MIVDEQLVAFKKRCLTEACIFKMGNIWNTI